MSIADRVKSLVFKKVACYECGQRDFSRNMHRIRMNFHGTLIHHEICDECYQKAKAAADHKKHHHAH
ncbi:MAG: hypothetical protein RIG82_05075 [Phycisphaeraceae bacterium]